MYNQPLPYNSETEKSVLASILFDKQDYIPRLNESDFYDTLCQTIYKAMVCLYDRKQTVDSVTVADAISGQVRDALSVTSNLMLMQVNPQNIEYYIEQLKDYSERRYKIASCNKIIEAAYAGTHSAAELKNYALQLMDTDIYANTRKDRSLKTVLLDVMEDIDKKYRQKDDEKLFTGFYDLDKVTGGLHPEELTIIAARPGIGKTAFVIQLFINLGQKGNSCLLVSREMSSLQIGKRILSNMAGVDGQKLRFCKSLKDEDFKKIAGVTGPISDLKIEINDELANIQEIKAYCRELKSKNSLDIVAVDYLQLCRTLKKCDSRRLEIDDVSRTLKEMSMELHIPVVALSQLSREAVGAAEPELNHLKESGGIEQDADNVLFLHVPKDTDETSEAFDIKVKVGKQRNGPTGHIWLRYYRKIFKFFNVR